MNRRAWILLGVMGAVGIVTFFIAFARPTPAPPKPVAASTATPMNTYLIDVAGWYEITPNESAVATPFDFSFDARAMPEKIGQWTGTAYDYGAAVDQWFENPDLALSSVYRDERGHTAWFSIFGSRGRKSYFLFEHTPITSYPAAGWTLIENGVTRIPVGEKSIATQKTTLAKDGERRIVFYWYLWQNVDRDPEKGVSTMRLHVPVISTDQDAFEAGADFLRAVFSQVVTWRRF